MSLDREKLFGSGMIEEIIAGSGSEYTASELTP
jgi:hypothetical protein